MPDRNALLGSWKLVSARTQIHGETVNETPFGQAPNGVIHYMDDGRMAVIIAYGGRPQLSNDRRNLSDTERLQAANTFMAYAGTFDVGPDRVIHHVDLNSYPNDEGVDYVRLARIEGDRLVLGTEPGDLPDSETLEITWRRMSPTGV